jgi:hypothetical protein
MAVSDRFNRTVTIKQTTQEQSFGFLEEVESDLVTSYKMMIFPPRPHQAQLVREEFGLEPNDDVRNGAGEYNASIEKDMIVDDGANSERFRILSVAPQRGQQSTPNHLAFSLIKLTEEA